MCPLSATFFHIQENIIQHLLQLLLTVLSANALSNHFLQDFFIQSAFIKQKKTYAIRKLLRVVPISANGNQITIINY